MEGDDEEELQRLYTWVDSIPLSRPKRSIARDFADGVLVAEVCAHYCPPLVQLHNYSAASSAAQKLYNWTTLNQKVLRCPSSISHRPASEPATTTTTAAAGVVRTAARGTRIPRHPQLRSLTAPGVRCGTNGVTGGAHTTAGAHTARAEG